MISLLACCVTKTIRNATHAQDRVFDPVRANDLNSLLPALKLSCDWLYANKDLWYPVPPPREKEL